MTSLYFSPTSLMLTPHLGLTTTADEAALTQERISLRIENYHGVRAFFLTHDEAAEHWQNSFGSEFQGDLQKFGYFERNRGLEIHHFIIGCDKILLGRLVDSFELMIHKKVSIFGKFFLEDKENVGEVASQRRFEATPWLSISANEE